MDDYRISLATYIKNFGRSSEASSNASSNAVANSYSQRTVSRNHTQGNARNPTADLVLYAPLCSSHKACEGWNIYQCGIGGGRGKYIYHKGSGTIYDLNLRSPCGVRGGLVAIHTYLQPSVLKTSLYKQSMGFREQLQAQSKWDKDLEKASGSWGSCCFSGTVGEDLGRYLLIRFSPFHKNQINRGKAVHYGLRFLETQIYIQIPIHGSLFFLWEIWQSYL